MLEAIRIKNAGYSIGIQNGIYSINEVRNLENFNLLSDEEGGNLHIMNGNMTNSRMRGHLLTRIVVIK